MSSPEELPDYDEASVSQIPALLQLHNLGYTYLTRAEAAKARESKGQYILGEIAFQALRAINPPEISDKSIRDALFETEQVPDLSDGIIRASEQIYSLLISGKAVPELIDGRRVSPQMRFINWKEPEKNRYHVCAEYELHEGSYRRPDIVCFVNGIPFAVIECKRESVPVAEAVQQMLRNQKKGETPKFFLFPQLLLATNVRELKYGTMLTPAKFYTHWKERTAEGLDFDQMVSGLINRNVDAKVVQAIAADLIRGDYEQAERAVTEQDRGIHALLEPTRLLDLVRNFVLYDAGEKKVARYQQYFAIRKTMAKLKTFDEEGRRQGGLIWHTQGSGKSLTMVMLVKCLIDDPQVKLPRVLVVTDRRDLDKQISDTFAACNIKKDVVKTSRAKDLLQLLREKDQRVITALIHKFDAAREQRDFVDDDPNIFVLIDEAHRTQGGAANAELNLVLPRACQIAFTGTPLMSGEKKSAQKFGGIIDAYTISEAEADGVVLPLIYQPRHAELSVSDNLLDRFYDQITEELTEAQKKDLQKKFDSSQIVEETSQRIESVALDIVQHYRQYRDTGLKAQVVAPSKYAAVRFKEAFDLLGGVETEVIISDSNDKADEDKLPERKKVVAKFLEDEKHEHGTSLDQRERKLIRDFKQNPEGVRILIVVDKLLTGFDAPRNTFLYLAKQLKDHNLLQAIARVNRLFDGDEGREAKVNGFVIDYSRNAKNLKQAMQLFANYDAEDVERALLDTDDKISELEDVYQSLHEVFKAVKNKRDTEAYIQVLEGSAERREHFYELVNQFIRQFAACNMLHDFPSKFGADKLHRYQRDLKRFVELKKIQKTLNAETVDFSQYEDQIRRILDKYVSADYVREMADPVCVSESAAFNAYLDRSEQGLNDKSKAEAIAAQTSRTIKENYHKDPEFYRHFSEKIGKLIADLRSAKEEDAKALLQKVREMQKQVDDYEDGDIPKPLKASKRYHPYLRGIRSELPDAALDEVALCNVVQELVAVVERHKIVDWYKNVEVRRQVSLDLEDYLFDEVKGVRGIDLPIETVERVISLVWKLAVENRDC
ncbi:MAG: type I restriction endonuclease subunit R [Opitutales bacterium]